MEKPQTQKGNKINFLIKKNPKNSSIQRRPQKSEAKTLFELTKYKAVYVAVPKQNTEYQYWKHTEVSLSVQLFK